MNRTKKTVAAILFGCLATSASAVEAQDTLAVFELESNEGETPRVLRMPYAKMARIERL